MNNRKRTGTMLLALTVTAALLTGCGRETQTASNSIFTGDPDALRIFVRGRSNYVESLGKQFPDVKFDFYYYAGLNPTMTMNRLMLSDDIGDISITSLQMTDQVAKEHLLDLSGYGFCSNYEPSILSQYDVDGKIYQLPGYVSMRDIIYNKTMFREHGWEEPQSFGELVELCRQIRRETPDITPIVMGGAASGYYFTTMTTYSQNEFLYTPEGQKWTESYMAGEAKAEDGFGAGVEMMQELIDAGAFDYEKNVGLWDNEVFEARMMTDEAAMMFGWGGQTKLADMMEEDTDTTYALMPFRNRDGRAMIGTNIGYNIGLAKSLAEKGNEKKLETALKIVEWLATEEGIRALAVDSYSSIFPIRNAENATTYKLYRDLWLENLDSIKAPMLYAGYEDILAPTAEQIEEAVKGNRRLDGLCEEMDELHRRYLEGGNSAIEAGSFAEDFTHAQTVQMFANLMFAKGDSDLALVSDGSEKNGVLNYGGVFLRAFKGPIIKDEITCYVPGENIMEPAEQLTLTGAQIRELLETGKHMVQYENDEVCHPSESEEGMIADAYFDYYWAGVDVEKKDGKITSMTLADGTEMEDDRTYTVTFAPQDYTDGWAEKGNPVPLDYTLKEAFEEYLESNSPVSAKTLDE